METPFPDNEAARLDALRRYEVLDTAPEDAFDDIARLAAQFCQTPLALVSFVDKDRQWFKSHGDLPISETPRDISFCAYAILQPTIFLVSDTRVDARFASNPLVTGPPGIRFYAGAPLLTPDGYALGTLSVLDVVPRQLSPEQQDALRTLSRQVMAQLELHYTTRTQATAFADLGYRLSAATTLEEAAHSIVETARILSGWDACSLDFYDAESDAIHPVLTMDTINEQTVVVPPAYTDTAPSPMARKTLTEGGQLLLRETTTFSEEIDTKLISFGDLDRPSESLLFVPVRSGLESVGILSIQSYTPHAYTPADLNTLQGLADHCAGAFARIQAAETLRQREQEERLARESVTALLAVSNELAKAETLDDLCRQAIEMGRSRLGFDRLGLWFLTDEPGLAAGSFGIDEQGRIRDERHLLISTDFETEVALMRERQKPYLFEESDLLYDNLGHIIGRGNHVMVPLWNGETGLGYIMADNYLSRQPLTVRKCELLSLYAATLGYLCTRAQTETALRKETLFAATALESLPGIFYFYDRHGRFLRWNRNFETVSGYSSEEIAAMHPLDFFTGEDKELIAQRIDRVFATGEATAEAAFVSKNGTGTPYFLTGRQIVWNDESYLIGMGVDITERKQLEEQLLQAQKMEGIGRLAGGIAHDFNNLLTAILGYADLTIEELGEGQSVQPYIENIHKAAERAATLTGQLLAFARKQIIAPRTMDFNTLIVEVGSILRRLIGEDIELSVLPGNALWAVKADPGQFTQVLINLAVNARDAMPNGGKLTIETANVVLDADYARTHAEVTPGEYVMLAVSDTGVGMEEAVQQHIFEPFFTTKAVGRGTGLGLATCYGVVKQSGGHIWLYSEKGQGTTFKIYLPRVPAEERVAAVPETKNDWRGTETILLVEDEPMVLELAGRSLRTGGYTVLEAPNGVEALRIAQNRETPVDLLVTDVVMPQMSGVVLAKQLQQLFPTVRVLFTSGYTDNSIVHHGILDAEVAFLQKPYTPLTLARKVREVLNAGY